MNKPTIEQVATSPAGWQNPECDEAFLGHHDVEGCMGRVHFEVFHLDPKDKPILALAEGIDEPGFYWWPCHPGCLPDGDANGPFPTAEGAYLDAIGD